MHGTLVSKVVKILFFCCLIVLLVVLFDKFFPWNKQQKTSQSASPPPVQLTNEERIWLDTHQPIRIAFDGYFPPYSFINESGQLAGIAYDTIQLITKKLDIEINIDDRILWKDIYSAALENEIDVIATMVNRPERKLQFTFTDPYVFKSLVIVTHKTNLQIEGRKNLSGKTVALVQDYQYSQSVLDAFPLITPYYVEKMGDALIAVETQQADAAISFFAASHFLQNKYLLSNIKFPAFYDRNSANESIAVRNDWPILANIFQKGLDSISETEKQAIKQKWIPPLKLPYDYESITQLIVAFLLILLALLLWIGQIKRQNQRIKTTQNKLITSNRELNDLKETLENQVLHRTKQLKNSEQKYGSLVENLNEKYFFYQHDLDGIFTYLSPSVSTILGYEIEDALKHFSVYLTDHPKNTIIKENTEKSLNGYKVPAYEVEVVDSNGHKRDLEVLESPLYDDNGQCVGLEGIAHDITLIKQTQERLNWLSYYDDLTGLPNRRLFTDRVEQMITLSHRNKESMALLFMDLDLFKMVNDNFGHAAGDEVLKETASRLQEQLRESDVAARMGGDEFTLVLPETDAEAAEVVAQKLVQSLMTPYHYNDQKLSLGASIGIAIYPQDGTDGETLLQRADNAMYSAKKNKHGYAFCSSDQHQPTSRRLLLEQGLKKVLAQHCYDDSFELNVVYQSRHCLRSNQILGYEALLRWQHPELGLILPGEFIPLSEETGLISELSHWLITKVCLQAKHWAEAGFDFGKISINISAVELVNFELAKHIISQINAAGAKPEWIEVELTESALMKTPDVSINIIQELKESGVIITIDDFGVGYSSLSYLKTFPVSFIKIDQSFLRDVNNSPEDQAVVHAIVAMTHALGKKVIAKGVETKEQLLFLAESGCDIAQGFWVSKPVAANELFSGDLF